MKVSKKNIFDLGFLFFFLGIYLHGFCQENQIFFKFPILEEGVYQLTSQQAREMGFPDLDRVSIFGNPGMLPQKLDSLDLGLREIPSKKIGDALYFFLVGPHRKMIIDEEFSYLHHYYSDTLYYLIGEKVKGASVNSSDLEISGNELEKLYKIQSLKWEESNLLSSGREWYSKPFFNGERFNFNIASDPTVKPLLITRIMAQSLAESQFEFFNNGSSVGSSSVSSIPNTTYGIKGRESVFKAELQMAASQNIQLSYRSSDINGTGYLSQSLLVSPYSNSSVDIGSYYILEPGIMRKRTGFIHWLIRDFYKVIEINGTEQTETGDIITLFQPESVPSITNWTSIDLGLRNENINAELIIISAPELLSQANRLADHKNQMGIITSVFTPDELYNAFGYGNRDITAIRNFLAHVYQGNNSLRNVLFFGKGTFDYKHKFGGRPNLVPTYSSRNSLNPLSTYSSDDYFGFLEFGQGEWEESSEGDELLQIGIGRIPATNFLESEEAVNKIINYEKGIEMGGNWKKNILFFADDGDNNIHLNDSETHVAFLENNHPEFEVRKLYLDRFEQVINEGIQSSPDAQEALKNSFRDGILLLNYVGHGNETTLTAERVFMVSDLPDYPENPLLPLFVTATCEFGRHDSPFIRSGAEELLFAQKKGAIALLTTGRPVFSSINFALNKAFIENVFKTENGIAKDLGEIFKLTKNQSLNGPFNRNFSLLGDPSLKLAVPELGMEANQILDIRLELETDTLKAMQEVAIKGSIIDPVSGAFLSNMEGEFELIIYDKPKTYKTLGDESSPVEFPEDTQIIFKGTGEVKDGLFSSQVFIPKNIENEVGNGIIRMFARLQDGKQEAIGAKRIDVGGTSENSPNDNIGPKITIRYGKDLAENPTSIASPTYPIQIILEDESGINIANTETGKNISLMINNSDVYILNSKYSAIEGSFKKGQIFAELQNLKEGNNEISIKAYDNLGNPSSFTFNLPVEGSLKLKILEHITYPNPSIEKSKFLIAHNRPKENLYLEFEVFSVKGDKIYSASKRYVEAEEILDDFEWNFFHSKTKNPTKGTYIYRLLLKSEKDYTFDVKSGKIIIQ
ncbi:type IX secretion system sortase PorU [Shivajiella indica]|uniref:Type IX secretion system sortase PorU n=1 Tax=Shivajiella indica TaxID=872115 RepID=A0ABW5BB92_9BACT